MNANGRTSAGMPMVYVLLPVHNRRDITRAFAECLKRQTYPHFRLVLIDDGSNDGTADAVREVIGDAIVIRGEGSWWWAGSLQQGHEWLKRNGVAGDDVVLVMNDDTEFEADFIAVGLRVLGDNPGALLTATGYNLQTGKPQDSGGYRMNWENLGFAETHDNAEINCTSTRGLMARVSDFLDVNGFHPGLLPHYLSDLEFTMRAQKKGKKLIIHPDFRIGINFETTGHRELGKESFAKYLGKIFSKRAAMNPVHWSNFILLHSPWKYKFSNLKRIWGAVYQLGVRERLIPELMAKFPILPRLKQILQRFKQVLQRLMWILPRLTRILPRLMRLLPKLKRDSWVVKVATASGLRIRTIAALSLAATVGVVSLALVLQDGHYVITPDNRVEKAAPGEFGIPRKEAEFLTHFSGKLIERIPDGTAELKQEIRSGIERGYREDGWRLSELHDFDTDRERLIAYMMLRVNGSLPVYKFTTGLPGDLSGLLVENGGNCSHAAYRLLMVLEAFGIKGRTIVWFSPSLGGHVLVDAYDPVEKKAYLLDSTFNLFSKFEGVDRGYFDVLSGMTVAEKARDLPGRLNAFPYFTVDTEGLQQDTNSFRAEQILRIRDGTLTALVYEMPAALAFWKKSYPYGIPMTLEEMAYIAGNKGLQSFAPGHPLPTASLLEMAGISNPDLRSAFAEKAKAAKGK